MLATCMAMALSFFLGGSCAQPPPLVYLSNPGDAVCLDGSPPAYSMDAGTGSGQHNWIVHLQGGGWCGSIEDCQQRSFTNLGSSKYMSAFGFGGFLGNSHLDNPGFYNWNRVYVRYCDGGSFVGNAKTPMQVTNNGQNSYLYFRGQLVWEAIIDDLRNKGLSYANKAILSGDSAGGLATILLCNKFQEKLSSIKNVKCLSDGGFFMDIPNIAGVYSFQKFFQDVVALHEITLLPSGCTSKMSFAKCFFPEYNLPYVNVPIFIVQPPYDNFQVRFILAPISSYLGGSWDSCKQDFSTCSSSQLSIIEEKLRGEMLRSLSPLMGSQRWGMYLVSCYYHTEVTDTTLWNGPTNIGGKNLYEAFHTWYFEGQKVQMIDCAYPCNPTCVRSTP